MTFLTPPFPGLPTSVVISGNNSPYTTGDSATLSCDVTGGNPATTSYSWTLGGTALPAEMLMILVITPLSNSNNGQAVTCTATNAVGPVTSAASTLDVQCKFPGAFGYCYSMFD